MRTTTFRPTAKAVLYAETGYSVDGRASLGMGVQVGIGPIKTAANMKPTSVRTDTSGTQSRAEEVTYDARILVHPSAALKLGDVMEVFGNHYRIAEIFPRYEMTGSLNHYQVDLIKWQDQGFA